MNWCRLSVGHALRYFLAASFVSWNVFFHQLHSTVNILTMHNAGPQLFLCIVTFYARRNVSQSVTICDLKMSHFQNHFGKLGSTAYLHGINIHEKIVERSLSDWVHLNNVGLCPSQGILRHLSIPQIRNFGQESAHDSPKMEACCKFGKFWDGKMSKFLATIHKKHIRVDFDPKNFRYPEENK